MEAQEIPKSEIIDEVIDWFYRIRALRAGVDLQV